MKGVYVKDLSRGLKIDEVFLVASKQVAMTRNGSPYMKLRLADRTGTIPAMKWNATSAEIEAFAENDIIRVRGTVDVYQERLQLTLDSCIKPSEPVDPSDFIRASERTPEEMLADLRLILHTVESHDLSRLLAVFFDDEDFVRKFSLAPAAKSVHHARVGGLLEHTLNVVRTCAALADLYPEVNRDLIIAGAALHDIGKIEEYAVSTGISISDVGELIGHVVIGTMMVREAADRIDGFDRLTSLALQHAVISHHGKQEWGSPEVPKSIEALMLHFADDLDAKADMFRSAIQESDGSAEEGLFTANHPYLHRRIFKGANEESQQPDSEDEDLDLFAVEPDWDPFAMEDDLDPFAEE